MIAISMILFVATYFMDRFLNWDEDTGWRKLVWVTCGVSAPLLLCIGLIIWLWRNFP